MYEKTISDLQQQILSKDNIQINELESQIQVMTKQLEATQDELSQLLLQQNSPNKPLLLILHPLLLPAHHPHSSLLPFLEPSLLSR